MSRDKDQLQVDVVIANGLSQLVGVEVNAAASIQAAQCVGRRRLASLWCAPPAAMTPNPYNEDHLVEQPALALLTELGWSTACGLEETFAPEGGASAAGIAARWCCCRACGLRWSTSIQANHRKRSAPPSRS